jgi:hypothetical protein
VVAGLLVPLLGLLLIPPQLAPWLDKVEATGTARRRRLSLHFLQPFDPDKTPVVLIHGLMSTPRMWKPVIEGLLADVEIGTITSFGFSIIRLDSRFHSPLRSCETRSKTRAHVITCKSRSS